MIEENYHEKFNRIIRKDTKPSKKFIYALYEPVKRDLPDGSLYSYGKETKLDKAFSKIQNFFIKLKAKREFKASSEEKEKFNQALDKIVNYSLYDEAKKISNNFPKDKSIQSQLITEYTKQDKLDEVIDEPRLEKYNLNEISLNNNIDKIQKQWQKDYLDKISDILSADKDQIKNYNLYEICSALFIDKDILQNYYLSEVCDILEAISYNYQNASIEQLRKMLKYIEKYQYDGIDQLNEQDNKKVKKILYNLHLCLTEQLLNLVQNNDFGYQKVK